jgi:hypothetical protein
MQEGKRLFLGDAAMKVRGVCVMLAVLVAVGFFAARAWAPVESEAGEKATGEAPEAKPAEGETGCPFCGQTMKPECMRMMTGPMRMRHRMMMNERLSAKDPSCIVALREELKLTEEQLKKLEEIVAKARAEAEQVLTEEQRKALAEVPEHGAWMRQMRERMMERRADAAAKEGPAAKEGESQKHEH